LQLRIKRASQFQQLGVELRLDGADREEFAIAAGIGVVERRTAVEHVRFPVVIPGTEGAQAVHHGAQQGRTVGHGGVHHLALAGVAGFECGADDAEGEHHGAAAEVADQVQRRGRRGIGAAHGVQHAGQGDVVQVVAGGLRQRAVLAPAGDAAKDQFGVARQAGVRAEAEALHDAGAEAFDQDVGLFGQLQHDLARLGVLQVERERAAAAGHDVELRAEHGERVGGAGLGLAVDADDLGAHVGQHHGGEGTWADADHFDDFDAC
jgi:hypothetical protein